MDGETVVEGDNVFDMVWGAGVVAQVHTSGTFVVRFAGTRSATFSQDGNNVRYPGRTLFWRNPIVVVPMKNERRWVLVAQIMTNVVSAVRAWGGP